jgi:hypothetical protein
MILDLEFDIGDTVYLKTDEDQLIRIITGIYVTQNEIVYYLSKGTEETKHYGFELTTTKNFQIN